MNFVKLEGILSETNYISDDTKLKYQSSGYAKKGKQKINKHHEESFKVTFLQCLSNGDRNFISICQTLKFKGGPLENGLFSSFSNMFFPKTVVFNGLLKVKFTTQYAVKHLPGQLK